MHRLSLECRINEYMETVPYFDQAKLAISSFRISGNAIDELYKVSEQQIQTDM